jgi:hypothetical protein
MPHSFPLSSFLSVRATSRSFNIQRALLLAHPHWSHPQLYYQYGEWMHRLLVETIGAPRRNIPSTRGTAQHTTTAVMACNCDTLVVLDSHQVFTASLSLSFCVCVVCRVQ